MTLKLIPVIDLKNGAVVHAKQGIRENYQPIKSVLTTKSDIYSVLNGFLKLHTFDTFYIADLDAIIGQNNQNDLIEQVLKIFLKLHFGLMLVIKNYELFHRIIYLFWEVNALLTIIFVKF